MCRTPGMSSPWMHRASTSQRSRPSPARSPFPAFRRSRAWQTTLTANLRADSSHVQVPDPERHFHPAGNDQSDPQPGRSQRPGLVPYRSERLHRKPAMVLACSRRRWAHRPPHLRRPRPLRPRRIRRLRPRLSRPPPTRPRRAHPRRAHPPSDPSPAATSPAATSPTTTSPSDPSSPPPPPAASS